MVTTRRVPMLAAGLVVAAALTGCAYGAPVQSSAVYDQADGSNVIFAVDGFAQGVSVRNALVLTLEEGAAGSFYATLANETAEDRSVELEATGDDGTVAFRRTVDVPAASTVQIGTTENADESIPVTSVPGAPGENITLTVTVEGQTQESFLPILDNTFPRYDELLSGDGAAAG
jgi:hypothetical protein